MSLSFLQRLLLPFRGTRIGVDRFGTTYWESSTKTPIYGRTRRWAVYARAGNEPTVVPPEWHGWLHHSEPAPLPERPRHAWQIDHRPNPSGTAAAYRPAGHDAAGGTRQANGGDYAAWTPPYS